MFAVYSMPRCRSAWLTFALGFNSRVYHDVAFEGIPSDADGVVETGCEPEADNFIAVVRDPDECFESIKAAYGVESEKLREAIRERYRLLSEMNCPVFTIDELADIDIIQFIQSYLTGECQSYEEIQRLQGFNIQVDKRYLEEKMAWYGVQ